MSNQASIPWTSRSVFWGYATGLSCLARASSYLIFPPLPTALSSRTFEQILSYDHWAYLFIAVGTVMLAGTWFQMARVTFASHLVAFMCYAIFCFASLGGIVEYETSISSFVLVSGWTGVDPLILLGFLHAERCQVLGAIVRLEHAARLETKSQRQKEGR